MSEFEPSTDTGFLGPHDYRRDLQTKHLSRTREAVMWLLRENNYGSTPVHVVRPAKLFARGALRAEIPNQPTTRWATEPPRLGWILEGVSNPPETSVSKDLGQLLLLDDLRVMVPSYFEQWGKTEDGLAVPASYLEPLTYRTPVRMERVSAELGTLLANARA